MMVAPCLLPSSPYRCNIWVGLLSMSQFIQRPARKQYCLTSRSQINLLWVTPLISQFSPIWGNVRFTPGRADGGFQTYADRGVQKIRDLYDQGTLLTLNDLCMKYPIPKKKYLQLKHFVSSKNHQATRAATVLRKLC